MDAAIEQLVERTLDRAKRQLELPESTYRLQFHAGFTFRDAIAILPYLRELGISHVYASPYLKSRKGSTHGYDVIDPTAINPEIGSDADHADFLAALEQNHLHHILDIVPNHMGVGTNDNAWWNDVLAHGRASRYGEFFDINWDAPPRASMNDRVLLPSLGVPFGQAIQDGQLKVVREGEQWSVAYFDRRFPLSPDTSAEIAERFSGSEEAALTPSELEELLSRQAYRLSFWRCGPDEINYRRFFEINDLAALRMERREVFEAVHHRVMEWLGAGKLAGVRIDHPDGLYDPEQYLARLQLRYLIACAKAEQADEPALASVSELTLHGTLANALDGFERDPEQWTGKPLYVVVEKILEARESLRQSWPVDGTSGYDFLTVVNNLLVDPAGEAAMTEGYERWIGGRTRFDDLVYQKKRMILDASFAGDLDTLTHRLDRLAQSSVMTRDFTFRQLRDALRELVACFPVYRSFITDEKIASEDVAAIDEAIASTRRRGAVLVEGVLEFIRAMLLLEPPPDVLPELRRLQVEFVGRFQQLTAPATAKGVEDTAFYIDARLVSLNEVGGNPGRFGMAVADVHAYFQDRQEHWPFALSALSTHDTKRSEDIRARLNVLSEMPAEWLAAAERWRELNRQHLGTVNVRPAPDANDEYFLYQTLVGAWPLRLEEGLKPEFRQRIAAYAQKWLREAKVNTSWNAPVDAYEKAVESFITALLDPARSRAFLDDIQAFVARVVPRGLVKSLSQTLIKITAPGVPDTYQGTEEWDLSLVDPDNRRPVDYAARQAALRRIVDQPFEVSSPDAKLWITQRALLARRRDPQLFAKGTYTPLVVSPDQAGAYFGFARSLEGRAALVLVPRLGRQSATEGLTLALPSHLPSGYYRNVFINDRVQPNVAGGELHFPLAAIFGECPVALLISDDKPSE